MTRTYAIVRKNGKPVHRELIQEERVEPKPTLYAMGRSTYRTSRSGFTRNRIITMRASGYDPSPGQNGGSSRTRMGTVPTQGQVAVDPRVIPLRSHLFIEGYGYAVANDTGGAIKGNRIDLCFASRGQAMQFGRRSVRVHILRAR